MFEKPEQITAYTYYVDRLAGELQAQDGLHNPYRRLSVLALSFPVLLHTIISCAAEHMYISGYSPIQLAIEQHARAIRSLRLGLAEWRPSSGLSSALDSAGSADVNITADDALLAAILLQPAVIAFSGGAASSAENHLDVAFYILNELKYLTTPKTIDCFVPRSLVQRFAIVDLGISTYHRRRPRIRLDHWFAQPSKDNTLDESQPSFREMTGCPHLVFTFLLRVMHLAADVGASSREKKQIYNDAIALETEMRMFDLKGFKEEPIGAIDHIKCISRAFTHATLLLLFRRVFLEASSSPRVQHAMSTIFSLMDMIPITSTGGGSGTHLVQSGIDSALGLPFYTAAREAVARDDQEWVKAKHLAWRKVYPNPARVRLMEVAERVWAEREKGGEGVEERCREIELSCEAYIF